MHSFHEENPAEALQAHRMNAQLYLAEILGIDMQDEEAVTKWILDNGERFATVISESPELEEKLTKRYLTQDEISFLRHELLSDKIDTGAEDHDDESFDRAA